MFIAMWAEAERGRLSLFLPAAMIAGDLIYFAMDWEPVRWVGLLGVGVGLGLACVLRRRLVGRGVAWLLFATSLGFAAAQMATVRALPAAVLPRRSALVTGKVVLAEALPDGQRMTLARAVFGEAEPTERQVRIRLKRDDPVIIEPGQIVRVRALVRPPAPPAYPGAWDLQRDDWFNGLAGYGYALGRADVLLAQPAGSIATLRGRIAARVHSVLPGAEGAISAVLLTGLPAAIPEADRAAFRGSGLAHLLAIAGLHIGIVMALVMGLTRRVLLLSEGVALFLPVKAVAGVAALMAGGCYAVLTGMHVPILRSFAMASLAVLGLLVGRRAVSLRGLAVAAAVIVALAPAEVVGVSFQMSFGAVLALIAGFAALRPALRLLHGASIGRRVGSHVVSLALTSLLAGAASAPFAAYHFGQIQLYFIVANVIAVPLTAFWVMPLGLLSLLCMPFGLERWPLWGMGHAVDAVLFVARTVTAWPAATLAVPHMPPWGLGSVALGMTWLGLCRSWPRVAGVAVMFPGLLSPFLVKPADILVSSDARVIAWRSEGGATAQLASGADRFVEDAFAQYWGEQRLVPLAVTGCHSGACRLGLSVQAAVLLRPGAAVPDCSSVSLIISAEPLGDVCADLPRVDRFTVWREGAQAIWLAPLRIVSDRAWRGQRPWVSQPADRREAVDLPMAQSE
jgi:competence protein ComEC